jgi:hypothetical protein
MSPTSDDNHDFIFHRRPRPVTRHGTAYRGFKTGHRRPLIGPLVLDFHAANIAGRMFHPRRDDTKLLTPFCANDNFYYSSRCLVARTLRIMLRAGPWVSGGAESLYRPSREVWLSERLRMKNGEIFYGALLFEPVKPAHDLSPAAKLGHNFIPLTFVGLGSNELFVSLGKILYRMLVHFIRLHIQHCFHLLPIIGIKCQTLITRDRNAEFSGRDAHVS